MPPSYSTYPEALDTSSTLPPFTDLITPVNAEGVNRLRDAILKIEGELGLEPSSTYGDVRHRLDAMETAISEVPLHILDNGTEIAFPVNSLNFTGGVSLVQSGPTEVTVTVTGGGGGGSSLTIQQDLSTITTATSLVRFTGNVGVTPITPSQALVNILGLDVQDGYGSVDSDTTILKFTGNVSVSDTSTGYVTVDIPGIEVLDGYVSVDSDVTRLNFTGNVAVYDYAAGYISVDVLGAHVYNSGSLVDSDVITWNFTNRASVSETAPGSVTVNVPKLAGANASSTLVTDIYTLKFVGNLTPTAESSTVLSVDTAKSKIKIYNNANTTTAAVDVATGVTFGTTSTNVTSTNASSTSTSVSPSVTGQFLITGSVGLTPNVSGISGILVEVRVNGSTVFSQKHQGLVLTSGTVVTTPFSFISNLTSGDLVTVRWTHSGSSDSVSQLSTGEDTTWLAISLL